MRPSQVVLPTIGVVNSPAFPDPSVIQLSPPPTNSIDPAHLPGPALSSGNGAAAITSGDDASARD